MPSFLFDTNVLIQYLRDSLDTTGIDAVIRASEMGNTFISKVSIFELWAPEKRKISERSSTFVNRWIQKMNAGELPLGVIELIEDEMMEEHALELPVTPQIEVIRPNRYWVITDELRRTFFQIQYQNGTLTISFPDQRRDEIQNEVQRVYALAQEYGIQILDLSKRAQTYAETVLEYHYRTLGKNAITDALIIGSGVAQRAWLVTNEIRRWCVISRDLQQRLVNMPFIKVTTPQILLQETENHFKRPRRCPND